MLKKLMWPALGATVLLVAAVYGCRYIDWDTQRPPDVLAEVALSRGTTEERQLAAAELTEYGEEAKQYMRDVLAKSNDENVKATCIQGLAKIYDYGSIEIMLDGLDSESPVIQGSCLVAVRKLIGRSFHFDPNMSQSARTKRIAEIRKEWESIRDSGLIEDFKARMLRKQQRDSS